MSEEVGMTIHGKDCNYELSKAGYMFVKKLVAKTSCIPNGTWTSDVLLAAIHKSNRYIVCSDQNKLELFDAIDRNYVAVSFYVEGHLKSVLLNFLRIMYMYDRGVLT